MRGRHHIDWLTAHAEKSSDISGTHPQAAKLLGGAGVRAAAALRSGSGRRDHGARDLFASAGAEAVQSRLRAAVTALGRRALRRKPQPAVQTYAVASDPETSAGKCAGLVSGVAGRGGH